jgi:glycosyltransferase involved in cell wall biosynthesis
MARILVLTKRQYTNKDLLDDRFGRLREIPLELARKGHQVIGLCLSYSSRGSGVTLDGPVVWESIDVTPLILPGLFRFLLRAAQLTKTVDFIWACSDSFYGIIAYFLGRKYRVPMIFDLYDNFEYFLAAKLPVIKQLYRWTLRKCDAVTCVSQPLAALVKTYRRRRGIFVVENGVRGEFFRPLGKRECRDRLGLPQEAILVGTAGALDENRGIDHLFKAFFLLKTKYPALHLVLAGPRRRSHQIPEDGNILDLGVLRYDDVPNLLNALDVAVICNSENDFGRYCFPQKAREIMACGVPLIAACVGAMKALLHANPEWLYVPDDGVDLARALENRFIDCRTNYQNIVSWSDAAGNVDSVLKDISKNRRRSLKMQYQLSGIRQARPDKGKVLGLVVQDGDLNGTS